MAASHVPVSASRGGGGGLTEWYRTCDPDGPSALDEAACGRFSCTVTIASPESITFTGQTSSAKRTGDRK